MDHRQLAFLAALAWPRWSLSQAEPFDAWVLGVGVLIPFVLAVAGLLAAVFVPQAATIGDRELFLSEFRLLVSTFDTTP